MTKTDADRFRKEAEECREQAAKAIGQLDEDTWLRLAAEWIKVAQAAEEPACAVASSLPMAGYGIAAGGVRSQVKFKTYRIAR
jgi:hypothetical protein